MNRSIRFSLLLNAYEKEALERLAEVEGGLSQSAMARALIRKAARERGVWPVPTDQRERLATQRTQR